MIYAKSRNLGPQCAAILGLPVSRRRCLNHAAEGETLCGVHREDYEYRAAILEYDAGHDRATAERMAMGDLTQSD